MKRRYILILIILTLLFLIGYEIYKGKINFNLVSNNSVVKDIYYCEDSSYQLTSNTCTKYIITTPILLGDVNLDNIVDVNDINIINDYISENKNLNNFELKAADVNGDSQVDANDISKLQEYLLNNDSSIGKNFICTDDYTLKNNLCEKKITIEAKKLNYKIGDINRDFRYDINDKILLEKYLSGEFYLSPIGLKIADINNDTKVDDEDLSIMKEKFKNEKKTGSYKVKNYQEININEDLKLLIRTKQNIKLNEVEINTKLDYYMVFNTTKQYYYKFSNFSDGSINELSVCKSVDNSLENHFIITVIGNNDYGLLDIYNDSNCQDKVATYETLKFKKFSEVKK